MNSRRRQGCAANEVPRHCGELLAVAAETDQDARQIGLQAAHLDHGDGQTRAHQRQRLGRNTSNRSVPTVFAFTIPIATTSQSI